MPVNVTYPGVYIEELPSAVRTIVGVKTAVAAFVGPARRGPVNDARHITSFADFERIFGGVSAGSLMSYAVAHFYQNGGSEAEIVRVAPANAEPSRIRLTPEEEEPGGGTPGGGTPGGGTPGGGTPGGGTPGGGTPGGGTPGGGTPGGGTPGGGTPGAGDTGDTGDAATTAATVLRAKYPGDWGKALRARVEHVADDKTETLYHLTVRDTSTGATESFLNVSTDAAALRALDKVLESSRLVEADEVGTERPPANGPVPAGKDPFRDPPPAAAAGTGDTNGTGDAADADEAEEAPPFYQATGGGDGTFARLETGTKPFTWAEYLGEAAKTGIFALLDTDIFNMLCVAPIDRDHPVPDLVLTPALELCVDRRAMLLVDPPGDWTDAPTAAEKAAEPNGLPVSGDSAANAVLYFPRVLLPDSEQAGRLVDFSPTGAMAGVWARTDAERGVWKAPAGLDASVNGVRGLKVSLTDLENGLLNPLGVNCLRSFPIAGTVSWGARTLRGADVLADQWKYLPVRRLALFIEETLYRGTKWVVFEPNDEPLWASIRLNVGAFMNTLFRQGAFQGRTPREAYLVKCDRDNNPQNDIDRGIVNILVGFAPLKPAEFVIIQIQQLAGQLQV
jgi:phage tail sheath protein FI